MGAWGRVGGARPGSTKGRRGMEPAYGAREIIDKPFIVVEAAVAVYLENVIVTLEMGQHKRVERYAPSSGMSRYHLWQGDTEILVLTLQAATADATMVTAAIPPSIFPVQDPQSGIAVLLGALEQIELRIIEMEAQIAELRMNRRPDQHVEQLRKKLMEAVAKGDKNKVQEVEQAVADAVDNPTSRFAHPPQKRREIVVAYREARVQRRVKNKEDWAQQYGISARTLLNYEEEFPEAKSET